MPLLRTVRNTSVLLLLGTLSTCWSLEVHLLVGSTRRIVAEIGVWAHRQARSKPDAHDVSVWEDGTVTRRR